MWMRGQGASRVRAPARVIPKTCRTPSGGPASAGDAAASGGDAAASGATDTHGVRGSLPSLAPAARRAARASPRSRDDRSDHRPRRADLAARTHSEVAQVLGYTVLLYRAHPDEPEIALPR
jgi:hypothetical protein